MPHHPSCGLLVLRSLATCLVSEPRPNFALESSSARRLIRLLSRSSCGQSGSTGDVGGDARAMITEAELEPGLVLHLDPDELLAQGATFTCSESKRVRGGHFFLCLSVEENAGRWLPLYSNMGIGRQALEQTSRTGHPKWTNATCYWHGGQVWNAPHSAVVVAAIAGDDKSTPGSRNRLAVSDLPAP